MWILAFSVIFSGVFVAGPFDMGRCATTGSIEGSVKDLIGPVAGAIIVLECHSDEAPVRDIAPITKSDGSFRIPALAPGKYTLRVFHEGYRSGSAVVKVKMGGTTRVDIRLEPE